MPEPRDDELSLLRAADPATHFLLPSADDRQADALFEVITMSNNAEELDLRHAPVRRSLLLLAAGLAALGLVGAFAVSVLRTSADPPAGDIAGTHPTSSSTEGPVTSGGPALGSCVETYDLETLANRELAFDGTVARLEGDAVTFEVNDWYRGGDGAEITLAGASALSGLTSAGSATTLEPGARLLVAGDGGFAWSCGFTQPYDPAVAQKWQRALNP